MKFKKILALLLAFSMLFVLAACKDDSEDGECECGCNCKEMMEYYNQLVASGVINGNNSQQNNAQNNTQNNQQTNQQQNNQQSSNQQQSSGHLSDDPTQWTKSQIVEAYKTVAGRTHSSVTSYQQMTLRQLNAPGINDTLLGFASGVMDQALQNNSKNITGITGGHQNLVNSDVKAARAYKSGNNTVIEMIMNEQVDGAKGNMYSGTVGHAISVVGDIDEVLSQFSALGMNAEIADENVRLHYSNPRLKVLVNSNGVIVNGTWSYVVNISLKQLQIKAMGLTVPVAQADAIVDFVVTLNGGFKEA